MTTSTIDPKTKTPAEFQIDAAEFAAAVKNVNRAAANLAGRMPVIRLTFKDQRVTLFGTDFDVAATIKVPVKGKRGADIAVDARKLAAYAKTMRDGAITVTVDAERIVLQHGSAEFVLNAEHDAPVAFDAPTDAAVDTGIPFDRFAAAVRTVGVCSSTDPARPILSGIFFDGDLAVATDSYRLGKLEAIKAAAPILVPATAAKTAVTMFGADTPDVVVDKGRLIISNGQARFSARLIDGTFPNWAPLVRDGSPTTFTVDRDAMIAALDKVNAADPKAAKPTRISITKNVAKLVVNHDDGSVAETEVNVNGNAPAFAVNGAYLASILRAAPAASVRFGVADPLKTIQIDDGTAQSPFTMVLMDTLRQRLSPDAGGPPPPPPPPLPPALPRKDPALCGP